MKQSRVTTYKGKSQRRVTLIEQYYNRLKPDMEFAEFQKICETPFRHMRDNMMTGEIYDYRYNFFGNVIPKPATILWLLENIQTKYREEKIEQGEYNRYIGGITRYISRKPKPFLKYAERLKPFIDITPKQD